MEKFLLTIFLIFFTALSVNAKNIPLYKNSINQVGVGIIKLPQEFSIYEKPDLKSKMVKSYKWGEAEGSRIQDGDYSDNFIIYDPLKDLAFMTVITDSNDGWYEVCYDQKNGLTGWVYPSKYEYYPWFPFFKKFSKENGLYPYKDLTPEQKRLYSQPNINSQIIGNFKTAKYISVQMYRGNWVLVRVYDYEGKLKIGWLRWRTDEGNFNYFPIVK